MAVRNAPGGSYEAGLARRGAIADRRRGLSRGRVVGAWRVVVAVKRTDKRDIVLAVLQIAFLVGMGVLIAYTMQAHP